MRWSHPELQRHPAKSAGHIEGRPARPLLRLASADTKDAADVLAGGPHRLYPDSRMLILRALALERAAARIRSREAGTSC